MTTSGTTHSLGGEITIGGDLTVRRMGFGAMRITGPGIWDRLPIETAPSSSSSTSWRAG